MFRSISALLGVALMLAGPVAMAQSTKPAPVVAAQPAPAVPWCPPGQAKDAVGKCVAAAARPAAEVPTVYQTVNGVRTAVAGPGAAKPATPQPAPPAAKPPLAAPTKVIAAAPIPAAKPPAPAAPPPAAKPARYAIAVGEPNGDCTTRAPNLIHDSRSPGGCAPCPRGYVPNLARQACVIPIPRRY